MKRAVFLDRDGVINKDSKSYIKTTKEVIFIPNIFKYISKINKEGYKIFVISNQSAINRKLTTRKNVENIHKMILKECSKNKCSIDGFYYCPHMPDEFCSCRKPKPGLIIKAAKDHKIDLKSSWMIGDKDSDINAGKKANCKTIKIRKNGSLRIATNKIINQNKKLNRYE